MDSSAAVVHSKSLSGFHHLETLNSYSQFKLSMKFSMDSAAFHSARTHTHTHKSFAFFLRELPTGKSSEHWPAHTAIERRISNCCSKAFGNERKKSSLVESAGNAPVGRSSSGITRSSLKRTNQGERTKENDQGERTRERAKEREPETKSANTSI